MVYVAVPEMTYRLARQRYTCLEAGEGGAASTGTNRVRSGVDLQVDADGLVIDYPGFWRRVET